MESLPDLVVEQLISYLDFRDLLKLRILCTTTKQWVERKSFLKLFENYPDDLDMIWKNRINCTRLNVLCDEDYPVLAKCVEHSSYSLRFIKLYRFTGTKKQLRILHNCTNLQYLSINTLDLTERTNEILKDSSEFLAFKKLLLSLQYFEVARILIRYPAGNELENYGELLKHLPALKTLNVPIIVEKDSYKIDENILLSIVLGFVVGPIIKYITRRAYHDPEGNNLKSLDLFGFPVECFDIFPELIRLCSKTGTMLENVNFSLIHKLIANRCDTKLLKVVRSVKNRFIGNDSVYLELKSIEGMSLDLKETSVYTSHEIISDISIHGLFPRLRHLEMNCLNSLEVNKFQNVENLANILFDKQRNYLRELNVFCSPSNSTISLFPILRTIANLENLNVLKVNSLIKFSNEDFVAILKCLRKLTDLEIEDECSGITDEGICSFGDDGLMNLLRLTDLKKLKIKTRCKYNGEYYPYTKQAYKWRWAKLNFSYSANKNYISDFSFKEVFRNMKLKSFHVESADMHITKIGYLALLDGPFAESVEYLPCPEYLPIGLSKDDFYHFRSNFPNFRNKISKYSQDQNNENRVSNCSIV